jgi:RNA polymerase sigma factor (sigma-70 family)
MHPALPDVTDDQLVAAVRAGDAASFAELYSRHQAMAGLVARRAGATHEDVDDVVAEAYARLLRALRGGRGPSENFPGYLAVAVRRIAWAVHQDATRLRPTGEIDRLDHEVDAGTDSLADALCDSLGDSPAGAALAALPDSARELLWRLEVEGERVADLARELGKSPNAVSAAATRARRRLRREYLRRTGAA